MADKVLLETKTLGNLLAKTGEFKLKIPNYQRIYCWEEKQVIQLIEDIRERTSQPYHMGSIILHKRIENHNSVCYDIVDGQQRLVTLSLILLQLGKNDLPFLEEKFESENAQNYIAYNKWLINNYLQNENVIELINKLLDKLQFSVLILETERLDLAYTFFSSENGKGKPLSDFDLLKSHHLRYVQISNQAQHLASKWDDLILDSNSSRALERTFEIFLFRLRKWMRKRNWDDTKKRKVKNEFEAAAIIPEIPPFGEQFHFYESIQGGAHFFAYAEHFIHRFKDFKQTNQYKALKELDGEKHWWYRDCIETLLFAYYLKFGTLYLSDACMLLCRLVSQHRYESSRAYIHSIHSYISNAEVVMMIEQATSPTFFLAEMQSSIKKLPKIPSDLVGTRKTYSKIVKEIVQKLPNLTLISYFND